VIDLVQHGQDFADTVKQRVDFLEGQSGSPLSKIILYKWRLLKIALSRRLTVFVISKKRGLVKPSFLRL
jgi:hypothetical protein